MHPDDSLAALTSNDIPDAIMKPLRKKRKFEATSDLQLNTEGHAQQKKRTKGKAKAGQLEGLMALPMDILFEVIYFSMFRLIWLTHSRPDIWSFAPT